MTCLGGGPGRSLPCDELGCPLPLAPDEGPAAALLDDPPPAPRGISGEDFHHFENANPHTPQCATTPALCRRLLIDDEKCRPVC